MTIIDAKNPEEKHFLRKDLDFGRLCVFANRTEPVFLKDYGAQESIPRHQFRQPMQPGGPVR
jgi:hypothetical protein